MNLSTDWARGYARQADADLRAHALYAAHPEAMASRCHSLLLLQMSCEKLCKAHLIQAGKSAESLQKSHAYIAKHLPSILEWQMTSRREPPGKIRSLLSKIREIAREIEVLNPSVNRGGLRQDNCEYPWESGEMIHSPLDHRFEIFKLVRFPAGIVFLKLLRLAINDHLKSPGSA